MKNKISVRILTFIALAALASPLLASPKTSTDKILEQAQKKEEAGDYEGAQKFYEQILKASPDEEAALLGLAQVQYWQGNYQAAIDTYAKILKTGPDHVKALVGTGKAYLALGKQRKAQEFFNRAEKMEPENEEVEAMKPQLDRKTKLTVEAGFLTQDLSFATQTQGEYQELKIRKEKNYQFGLNTAYLRKFSQDAFDTRLFGSYFFLEETRVDLAISFAPKTAVVPRQGYEAGLAQTFWIVTPEIHYRFEDYRQANLHMLRPAIYLEPLSFLKVGGGYEFQNLRFGNTSRNFHSTFGEVNFTPLEWFSLNAFYSRIERGFEGGRASSPFANYKAHVAGGSLSLNLMDNYFIRFKGASENRNNGETVESYITSLGYFF